LSFEFLIAGPCHFQQAFRDRHGEAHHAVDHSAGYRAAPDSKEHGMCSVRHDSMGLDVDLVRLLLEARQGGASFRSCVTLGRQHYFPGDTETRALLRQFGINAQQYPKLFTGDRPRYSEPFWEAIGVERLETMDASDFEGATIVHDMNRPIPAHLVEQFDAVCDAGTLEHIFDLPAALRNCMSLVRVGGRLFLFTTANNYCGHGFYQFSPELFFRAFSRPSGFEVERMVAVEYGPFRKRFEVSDPEVIRRRVNLINSFPVLLFVQAKRLEKLPLLAEAPQQSDYLAMWTEAERAKRPQAGPPRRTLRDRLKQTLIERTPGLARFLEAFRFSSLNREFSFRDRGAYRRSRR
jgi:SAM-dependent methyltransferase